jgi:tetratricopeptide (TPR) repeat protein
MLGEVDDAAEQAANALQLLGPSAHIERVSALLLLGDVGTAQLNLELAGEAYQEARTTLSRMLPTRRVARLWRELGDSLRSFGDQQAAVTAYDNALRIVGMSPRPAPVRDLSQLAKDASSVTP